MTRQPKRKAAKTTAGQLQSATARLKLAARTRPYFIKVARGAWLGYRKPLSGPGSWTVRVGVADGKGWEKTLWSADDNGVPANGETILNFWQAKSEAQKLSGRKLDASIMTPSDAGAPMTLDDALSLYSATLRERGASQRNAALGRSNLTASLRAKPIALLTEEELRIWRGTLLAKGLVPSTVNRYMNCVRAALTLADKTRLHIWRDGLKALPDATESNNTVIEDEAKAQQWVAASYALDHHLGLLTHVPAESGARPSQAVRLRIRDLVTLDPKAPRLMMPKSGKGRTLYPGLRKVERYPVSISPELARLLKTAAKGRPSNAPLLLYRDGKPWNEDKPSGEYRFGVRSIVESIGLDPNVYGMYALRHTSTTRMLRAGTHTAIVAKSHDTSERMIRQHYAADILEFTDAMTRRTLPAFGPAPEPASNVVPLAKR